MSLHPDVSYYQDDYCVELMEIVSLKMQALKREYQPHVNQWNEAVEKINILVSNFLSERYAVRHCEYRIQRYRDAIDGEDNDLRSEARDFLRWHGLKKELNGVDPVVLYLRGPLEVVRREMEKCADEQGEAEEALWEAINELHSAWKDARENPAETEDGFWGLVTLSTTLIPAGLDDAVDNDGRAAPLGADASDTGTDSAMTFSADAVVVGLPDPEAGLRGEPHAF